MNWGGARGRGGGSEPGQGTPRGREKDRGEGGREGGSTGKGGPPPLLSGHRERGGSPEPANTSPVRCRQPLQPRPCAHGPSVAPDS